LVAVASLAAFAIPRRQRSIEFMREPEAIDGQLVRIPVTAD